MNFILVHGIWLLIRYISNRFGLLFGSCIPGKIGLIDDYTEMNSVPSRCEESTICYLFPYLIIMFDMNKRSDLFLLLTFNLSVSSA